MGCEPQSCAFPPLAPKTLFPPCIMQHHWFMIVLYIWEVMEPKFAHSDCTAALPEKDSLSGTRVCRCLRCASQMDWHIYEGFPAWWDTETGPQLIGLSFTGADIYPMHCSWTQSDARIPCAAGKIVLRKGRFLHPCSYDCSLNTHTHAQTNKHTNWYRITVAVVRCWAQFTCQISVYSAGGWK